MSDNPLDCICTYDTKRPPEQGTRTVAHRHPKCPVDHPAPISPENPLPIMALVHDGDRTRKYIMWCRDHKDLQYRSKDPRGGSAIMASTAVCECHWTKLEVIGREQ